MRTLRKIPAGALAGLWGRGLDLFKFLAAGLPSFLVAVPLNYALVEYLRVPKWLAYGSVMALQVTANFFMCRIFVFKSRDPGRLFHEFRLFFAGIMFFRLLDWGVYVLFVQVVGWYYLLVQVLNVAVFAILKFLFSERVFLHGRTPD